MPKRHNNVTTVTYLPPLDGLHLQDGRLVVIVTVWLWLLCDCDCCCCDCLVVIITVRLWLIVIVVWLWLFLFFPQKAWWPFWSYRYCLMCCVVSGTHPSLLSCVVFLVLIFDSIELRYLHRGLLVTLEHPLVVGRVYFMLVLERHVDFD